MKRTFTCQWKSGAHFRRRKRPGRGSRQAPGDGWFQGGDSLVLRKGEALANELGGIGVTGSNQSNDDLQRLVDAVMRQWGRIDVLVNNGGHGPRGPVLEITDEQWHLGLDIYLMNVIRPVRIVAPIMQAQKSGSIINFHRSRPSSRLRDSRRPRCSGQDLPPTQGLRGYLCRRQRAHEQHSMRLDRQPADGHRALRWRSHETLWKHR